MKQRPSKQPAVPAAFTTSLTNTEFSPAWHTSGDTNPVTLTMNMEAAYSSKTLATTPLKCHSHQWHTEGGGGGCIRGFKHPPSRNSEGPPKSCQTQPDCENLKTAEFRMPTSQDVREKKQ
jgi:hypothetical protein